LSEIFTVIFAKKQGNIRDEVPADLVTACPSWLSQAGTSCFALQKKKM
jgi:hypothetical protein